MSGVVGSDAAPGRESVALRVRRFAALRAAQRALDPSSSTALAALDLELATPLRERLREAATGAAAAELPGFDAALGEYRDRLVAVLDGLPLAQLRASLSGETHVQRVEVNGLLRLCLDAEPRLNRYLCHVDFLVTLLCATLRDGRWILELDPTELNDEVLLRGQQAAPPSPDLVEDVAGRFEERPSCAASPPCSSRDTATTPPTPSSSEGSPSAGTAAAKGSDASTPTSCATGSPSEASRSSC